MNSKNTIEPKGSWSSQPWFRVSSIVVGIALVVGLFLPLYILLLSENLLNVNITYVQALWATSVVVLVLAVMYLMSSTDGEGKK